jgi:hypothetical protein
MSDLISRISNVNPTYPVRPVQPTQKDGDADRRRKERPGSKGESDEGLDDDIEINIDVNYEINDDQPAIDEYV